MVVSLITEGTYPTAQGGVSVWCDQLVRGLRHRRFTVHAIVSSAGEREIWPRPPNVGSVELIPLWADQRVARFGRDEGRGVAQAFERLLDTLFRVGDLDVTGFLEALRTLREPAQQGHLAAWLRTGPAADMLLSRWAAQRLPGQWLTTADRVPPPSVRDASTGLFFLEHFLRPLAAPAPTGRICHAVSNGLACLPALAARWERGTPFVLSEHGIYLRERYLEYRTNGFTFAVRALVLRFFRLLTTASYHAADIVVPGSDYNRRWQVQHDAPPDRIRTVRNGIEPSSFLFEPEPAGMTISWLGRITPIKDLGTLVRAFRLVLDELPSARLRIFGSAPAGDEAYLASCRALVESLDLDGKVTFEGRVERPSDAYRTGNVVALSSASEGFPYTLIEAMATGRATVATDVGGVREAAGDAGVVVPARDARAFADACVELLTDRPRRQSMGRLARVRAIGLFDWAKSISAYRAIYRDAAQGVRADVPA